MGFRHSATIWWSTSQRRTWSRQESGTIFDSSSLFSIPPLGLCYFLVISVFLGPSGSFWPGATVGQVAQCDEARTAVKSVSRVRSPPEEIWKKKQKSLDPGGDWTCDDYFLACPTTYCAISFFFRQRFLVTVHKTHFFKMPWMPPFIHDAWWMLPVELYIVFLCQSAIMMLTNIFAHSCTILRYAIKSLRLTMTPEDMDWSVFTSVNSIQ